eukprot:TRINITY_DN33506_c0_g1_i1.p1 TRINITY_DN33506_c0_g1~~TRINITY_DN33506_c0_g1_i1.p1  ORF type:complete len:321 (+),score=92.18 TRINITY_DN33506_c0_g1_i1:58-963(+)
MAAALEALKRYAIRSGGEAVELVDIGANLTKLGRGELHRQLHRAAAAGVSRVILTGTSMRATNAARKMVDAHAADPDAPRVKLLYTAGIHPHDAKTFEGDQTIMPLQQHLRHPLCVASGETGLDYDRMFSTREQQIAAFTAQVRLACEAKKPLFIHERDRDASKGKPIGSHADLVSVLGKADPLPRVCIHCFTADAGSLRDYVSRGYYIGITGFVGMARRGAHLREALSQGIVPVGRLMIETDAPYMKPDGLPADIGVQGRTNEPCVLPSVVRELAVCLKVEEAELARQLTANTVEFFGLS